MARWKPQLDVSSAEFDPELALKAPEKEVKLPVRVRPLDTLAKCAVLLPPGDELYVRPTLRSLNQSTSPASSNKLRADKAQNLLNSSATSASEINANGQSKEKQVDSKQSSSNQVVPERRLSGKDVSREDVSVKGECVRGDSSASLLVVEEKKEKGRRGLGNKKFSEKRIAARLELKNRANAIVQRAQAGTLACIMAEAGSCGTLAMLWRCQQGKIPVRVLLRRQRKLRGSATGRILAFDKHFNMVLSNVYEEYTLPNVDDVHTLELHERHIAQLFIKGDNVVLVQSLSSSIS